MRTAEERQALIDRLEAIRIENGGVLRPDDVVADAKQKDSPLHSYFTWDIAKAAQAHWLDQARALITSIKVVHRTETTAVRAVFYTRDPAAGSHEQGYRSVASLRSDVDMAREAVVNEFANAAHLLRRARAMAVALGEAATVDELIKNIVGVKERIAAGEAARTM